MKGSRVCMASLNESEIKRKTKPYFIKIPNENNLWYPHKVSGNNHNIMPLMKNIIFENIVGIVSLSLLGFILQSKESTIRGWNTLMFLWWFPFSHCKIHKKVAIYKLSTLFLDIDTSLKQFIHEKLAPIQFETLNIILFYTDGIEGALSFSVISLHIPRYYEVGKFNQHTNNRIQSSSSTSLVDVIALINARLILFASMLSNCLK